MNARGNAAREREFQEWARSPGGLWWDVEGLKQQGNAVFGHNPREAVFFYTRAINIDSDRSLVYHLLTPRERATLHSNRCTAFMKLQELGRAFDDAITCIQVDPTFQKGYWRAAMVMKQMNKENEALEALIDGYPNIRDSDEMAMSTRVNFVEEITLLSLQLWEKWKKSQYLFRLMDVHTSVWTLVVQRLAKKNEYYGLRLVFLLGGTQSGRVYEIGQGGAATGCHTSAVDLKPLVRGFTPAQSSWSMHLILELLKHGSKVEGLSQREGDTPLHCAVENVLNTGWVHLLQYLLSNVYNTSERRNLPDRFGDSLFHLIALTSGPSMHARTAIEILQKYGIDPSRSNRYGCLPVDVVPPTSVEVRGWLIGALQKWEQERRAQLQQMMGQRLPQPGPPNVSSANNFTQPKFSPTPQPRPRQQFFDPSRIFGSPHRPQQPQPFFDHSKLFPGQQKSAWQQEEVMRQKQREEQQRQEQQQLEQQRQEQQQLEQQRQEQQHLKEHRLEQQRQEMRQQQQEDMRRRDESLRRQRVEQEVRQRQREEADRWRQLEAKEQAERQRKSREEEKKRKETERQEKARQQREEKKRRDNQKKKEKREIQKKKEEELRRNAFQRGLMFQEKGKHDSAIPLYLEFISGEHRNTVIYRDVSRCVDALIESLDHVQEIPDTITCSAPPTFWNSVVQELADANKWWSLFLLLVGRSYGTATGSRGIAHGCDASGVSIVSFLNHWEQMDKAPGRLSMVRALLESNANPNGLLRDSEAPLLHCVRAENYELVNLLLKHGAAPSLLVVDSGDTPLHSALKIGFKQDDRKFMMLDLLLKKYSSDPTSAYYLDKNAQDRAGNTLLHVALTEGSKNQSLMAVKLLSGHNLNPRLRNHAGKVPLSMVSKNDRRFMYLADAAKLYDEVASMPPKPSKVSSQDSGLEGIRVSSVNVPDHLQTGPSEPASYVSRKDMLRLEVKVLLNAMPVFVAKQLDEVETAAAAVRSPPSRGTQPQIRQEMPAEGVEVPVDREQTVEEDQEEEMDDEEEDKEDTEMETREAIDANIFDDLIWEVECTAKVWKFLHDRQFPHHLKETAIRKIKMLGEGNWRGRLCKPLEGLPKQHNMKLYEARLTKGGRILWELAIAFSPRCSEDCSKRLESGDDCSEGNPVAGGRVYSEIIRIWDIVPDHVKVARSIEVIVKSVERGEECIIRKNLIGIKNKEDTGSTTGQRLPTYFREVTGNSPDRGAKAKKVPQLYSPPASSKENEYHIMKFYSITSTLISAVLNDSNVKVDFPFRVTELEHAIINLQPKPPSSILLLGRSGTGKTTCCLYRMWTKFFKYWQKAAEIGEPWIPRDIAFIHQDEVDTDEGKDNSEDETTSGSCQDSVSDSHGDHHNSSNVGSNSSNNDGTAGSSDNSDDRPPVMDHLHQIFLTKNAVLCSEVQRNFCDMTQACEFASEPLAQRDTPLPHRLQDAHPARFPLFLSSHQFLLLLDASLPDPYFPRATDGSLKRKIHGWDEEDGPLTFIPLMEDDDEEDEGNAAEAPDGDQAQEAGLEDETHPLGRAGPGGHHDNPGGGAQAVKYDPRREVTYDIFAYELWPRINKKKLPYHSTLVWMEITSFIKGSVESLHTQSGHLSLDSYLSLGKKRASNFTANREDIYSLFKAYEHIKSQRNLFDEGDMVFHVYRRLRDVRQLEWSIHELYVDETQDFTQAELSLFIRCSHNPNSLFLTGDTAQSIMRGVAFRFQDLKSLFHYASKSFKGLGKHSAVTVPKKVYQLTHNYRSHAGILNLASTIVNIMAEFFPNSFDHLERDQGLFQGPPPVLLESCSFSDLALLLCGNKRKTSEIEFGAHQVILVANEEAIDKLPAELQVGLVMTIYEAKGLEFDDVLLYNFFKDSPADKEWRVITKYLDDLIAERRNSTDEASSVLKEIDLESLTSKRPRPLEFNPDEHKVLNSELKYLYTAITRARVNVWIFDEDETKRAPMFELMRHLSLVKVIRPDKGEKISNPSNSEESVPDLDAMFVEKSSQAEWVKRGDYFFQNKLWMVAAKCYQRGGNDKKALQAQAHHQAVEAERLRDHPQAMREAFLLAASLFLKCDCSKMAVNCLYNAREFGLRALLFEKRGEFSNAAKIYEKRLNYVSDACRCWEQVGDYAKALDLLCSNGFHSKALDVVDRFKRFKKGLQERPLPRHIKPPGSTHSLDEVIYKSAEYHYKHVNHGEMLGALDKLGQFEARVDFLRKRGLFTEAVAMLKEDGQVLEAAKLLRQQGKLEDACILLESSDNPEFVAECHLSQARKKLLEETEVDGSQAAAVSLLGKAEDLFSRCTDSVRKAETKLLLGQLQKDATKIREADRFFNKMPHYAGESECTVHLIKLSPPNLTTVKGRVFQQLRNLLQLICALFDCGTAAEERQRLSCEEYFGLVPGEPGKFHILRCEGARIVSALGKNLPDMGEISAEEARHGIAKYCLIPRAVAGVEEIQQLLHKETKKLTQCGDYLGGRPCTKAPEMCKKLHQPYSSNNLQDLVTSLVRRIEVGDIMEEASKVSRFKSAEKLSAMIQQTDKNKYKACKALYDLFYPKHCHHRFIGQTSATMQIILKLVRHLPVKKQLKAFAESERKNAGDQSQQADTDLYLMCHGIHLLVGEGSKIITGWVRQEEDSLLQWQRRNKWIKLAPLGMHQVSNRDREKGYLSYKQRHLESFENLYFKLDVMSCLVSFNRFMGTPANRPRNPLLPSISNTVAMIEAKVTMMLALGAKTNQCCAAVPASYLAQAVFLDAVCCPGEGHAMYKAVSKSAIYNKDTSGQIHSLVNWICGSGRSGHKFNVLADAFRCEKFINTGEAERTLVLVLVMLCNAGLALPIRIITDIRDALQTIAPSEEYLPKRVYTALCQIKSVDTRRKALQTLQDLLAAREDEFLRECVWKDHMPPRGAPGLDFKNLNTSSFKDVQFNQLTPVSPTVFTLQAADNIHQRGKRLDEEEDEQLEEASCRDSEAEEVAEVGLEVSAEEAERVQRDREEKAAKTIIRVMRNHGKSSRLLRLASLLRRYGYSKITIKQNIQSESEKLANEWVSKQLLHFTHDVVKCTICDVNLQSVQFRVDHDDTTKDLEEDDVGKDNTEESLSAWPGQGPGPYTESGLPTQEEHEATLAHKETRGQFLQYGQVLKAEVYPLFTEAEKLLTELRFPTIGEGSAGKIDNPHFFEEKLSRPFKELQDKMADIQSRRAFELLGEIRYSVEQLQRTYDHVKDRCRQLDDTEQRRAVEQQDKMAAGGVGIEEGDTIEEDKEDDHENKIVPVLEQQHSVKGGRNKGRNQKRQKGKWNKQMGKRK